MFEVLLCCDSLLVLIIMNNVFWTHSATHIAKGADVQLIKMCNCMHLALFLTERVVLALLDSYILYWSNQRSSFLMTKCVGNWKLPRVYLNKLGANLNILQNSAIQTALPSKKKKTPKYCGEISLLLQFCQKLKNHIFVTLAKFKVCINLPYYKTVERTKSYILWLLSK